MYNLNFSRSAMYMLIFVVISPLHFKICQITCVIHTLRNLILYTEGFKSDMEKIILYKKKSIQEREGLRGAIGQRVRLLTERLVVQAHPGTIIFIFIFVFSTLLSSLFYFGQNQQQQDRFRRKFLLNTENVAFNTLFPSCLSRLLPQSLSQRNYICAGSCV